MNDNYDLTQEEQPDLSFEEYRQLGFLYDAKANAERLDLAHIKELHEYTDELYWDRQFESNPDALDKLANQAWADHDAGLTDELDPDRLSDDDWYTLTEGEDGFYVIEVPTLPGCVSQGKTINEALTNIQEAIEGYIAVLIEDGKPIPKRFVRLYFMSADQVFTPKEIAWAVEEIGKRKRIK